LRLRLLLLRLLLLLLLLLLLRLLLLRLLRLLLLLPPRTGTVSHADSHSHNSPASALEPLHARSSAAAAASTSGRWS
jgi:hypothetical protein